MFLLYEREISWTPAVDIYEEKEKWLVFVELPGVPSDDIDITVFPESVLVKGIKTPPARALSAEKIEIYTGYFQRRISILGRINIDAVTASLKDGVLSIVLPFEEQESIKISVDIPGEPIEIEKGD